MHSKRFVSKLNTVCFFSFVGDILFYYYSKYSYDISDRLVTSALKDPHLSAIGTSANILHRCNSIAYTSISTSNTATNSMSITTRVSYTGQ